ncbi:WD-40 repeat protein [Amycolatopsis camponoti]|uniref:WD-40 repeat protein n=1 Tax=Amycolatopsis camponoti TaxID=2606593 RepID=A0A6I8M115_9PSEU|nr:caspase family protein [Amycolatopsis camponoti]VVJ22607.1 WD-40 repeat protein [Amycolatopsis camponoti]
MRDDSEPRRYLIATAIANYPNQPSWNRPRLGAARDEIVWLFTQDLGYKHISDLGLNPTRGQLTTLLRDFCRHKDRREDDLLAVYIGGHGEVLDATHEHVLLTTDTTPDDIEDALPTAELARKMLLGTKVRRVLLMLDTCYSGQGGSELTAAAITKMTRNWGDDDGAGLAVITSAQPSEQAGTGAFSLLLRDAVRSLPVAGYNPATLPLDSIVKAMNANASKPGYQTIGHSIAGLTGEVPPFLPNPRRHPRMTEVDLSIQHASEFEIQAERRDTELRTRLLVRAMGGSSRGNGGWWFAGRRTALLDITAWLHAPDPERPLQVVTGNPGSGKTAVLGLIATLTHPQRRATVPLHALRLPAAAVPRLGAVDVAIYAQSLTTDQVLAGIAAAVRSHASTPGQLLEELSCRDTPLTVLIDALDEAADPDHLTRRLLRPLVDHAEGQLRLLVGTRDFLLARLGLDREDSVDLDADRYADLDALTAYAARGLLEANPNSPYLDAPPPMIRAVADAVAAAANPSFLVARITSATLAAQDEAVDPANDAWRRSLPAYPGDAMRHDLESRLGANAAKARDLLRPLAFAEGQGLPWEDIWAAVASRAAGTTYTDDDLFWLREHAGSYVVEAAESDRSTYRLYHRALADHLQADVDATAMHRAIAEVLVTRVPRALDGRRDWTHAHPYTLRHLATHAARAGHIDNLVADTEYLVHAEPDALLLALHKTTTETCSRAAAVYRCSADIHRHLPASRRRQVLAVDAARFLATQLQRDLCALLTWQPRWATGQQADPALHATFSGHTDWVRAAACGALDGRPVAITGGDDKTVRVWDLATGSEVAAFTGHTDWVNAVACAALDGRPVAITGSDDDTVRVWDLATAGELTTFTGHTDWVNAVACAALDGRPVAITGSDDYTVRVWDLATGSELATFTGHTGSIRAVACAELDGRPVAITGSDDKTVRVWDLATAQELTTFTGHTGSIRAVACAELDGRPVAITGSDDKTVRVWDLATAQELTTFTGHTGSIRAVACAELDGRPVAITGSDDKTVRVWDLATAQELTTFTGHTDWVNAVACAALDRRPVAVTVGDDATARVWRLPIEAVVLPAGPGHSADIRAETSCVLDGCPVAITAGDDKSVRVWDLATGSELAIFTGHTGSVRAVACAELDGHPVAITASSDKTARVWDLATGSELATFTGHTGPVRAVACAELDGRSVAVTGDDKTTHVWDIATAEELDYFTGRHTGWAKQLACAELGGRSVAVAVGGDGAVPVWDLATGSQLAIFTGHTGSVHAVACAELDGHPVAITAGDDKIVRVWNLATAEELTTFTGHTGSVHAVASGVLDGRPIAVTASDKIARVWDLATAKELAVCDLRNIGRVAIGPGGELMITAGWDLVVLDRIGNS